VYLGRIQQGRVLAAARPRRLGILRVCSALKLALDPQHPLRLDPQLDSL
jgi:hypothetical protein